MTQLMGQILHLFLEKYYLTPKNVSVKFGQNFKVCNGCFDNFDYLDGVNAHV